MKLSTRIKEVMKGNLATSKDTADSIEQLIIEIDQLISIQLNEIIHHEEFQKLEASWRGLSYLVNQTETGTMLKLRVLNASKQDLWKDLYKVQDFDQSGLFKKVNEEPWGPFGGAPFGAIIGDYEFGHGPKDISLLGRISNVAAAAHAPFLSAASSEMFNLDSFTHIPNRWDMSKIFESSEYVQWKSFREFEDSLFVGLTLPHVLMRLPYGPETAPVEAFNFKEDVDGKDHKKYLWGNAAYALGARLTNAFAKYGWWPAICSVEGGGLVEGLPSHTFNTDDGEMRVKGSTEIAITEKIEMPLRGLGFIPLLDGAGTGRAAFFGMSSCRNPKDNYDYPEANKDARLRVQLPYVLTTSRFAHYLKAIVWEKNGSFMTRQKCEDFLNTWLSNYVLRESWDTASMSSKAQYPLRQSCVDVVEVPGKPGVDKVVMFIEPQFLLDELPNGCLRAVVELPAPLKRWTAKDGLSTECHDNGQKKFEGHYSGGKLDGVCTWWYTNGQKKAEGHYKDGKLDGACTWWHANGQKEAEEYFKHGIEDGIWTKWSEDGKKTYEKNFIGGDEDQRRESK